MEIIHFIIGGRGYGKSYCMKKVKYNLQVKSDKWINFNDKLYNLETGHKKLEKLKKKFPTKEFRLKQIKITKI